MELFLNIIRYQNLQLLLAKLQETRTRRSWGDRSFSAAAPLLWNALPTYIKSSKTTELFHKHLKTYLIKESSD